MKRAFDVVASSAGLLALSPVLVPVMVAIWWQDKHSPFYVAPRVGKGGKPFRMVKLRSMVKNADKSGVASTKTDDMRITKVGHFVRRYKLDEFMQLWNVLKNDMSLVGPRPQVQKDVDLYTPAEQGLLNAKPGITDFASIVFSDEGDVLKGSEDPDLRYHQVIRPWKSRLALFYLDHQSVILDVQIIFFTVCAILSRKSALRGVHGILERLGADETLKRISLREEALYAYPPPGASNIVTAY